MCLSPLHLSDGNLARCRKCWQCTEARVDGWVGRCIAESRTAAQSVFITLTYGRDEEGNESHARAAILTYSDVQKYFKTLRKRGLRFRYLVVGEVGSLKGRTHWHICIFFEEKLPDGFWDYGRNSWHRAKREQPVWVPQLFNKRYNHPLWPHGFSQWDPLHYGHEKGGVRYACKYINEDVDDPEAQSKLCMSKRPPIGAVYFDKLAQKLVLEGVSPQDAYYQFPNQARRRNGTVIRFKLENRSLELYIENYIRRWLGFPPYLYEGPPSLVRGPHWPHSQMIDEYLDKKTRETWDRETVAMMALLLPVPPFGYRKDDIQWEGHIPVVMTPNGKLYFGANQKGQIGWRSEKPVIDPERVHRRQQELTQSRRDLSPQEWLTELARQGVLWMSTASLSLGRYRKAKLQKSSGPAVWLQSQKSF